MLYLQRILYFWYWNHRIFSGKYFFIPDRMCQTKGNIICIDQFFCWHPDEEHLIPCCFLELLKPYRTLITFNGLGFDIHYLTAKCQTYGMPAPFLEFSNLDIFRALSKFKKDFQTAEFKAKDRRKILRDRQEDLYSAAIWSTSIISMLPRRRKRHVIFYRFTTMKMSLGMIDLLPILSLSSDFSGSFYGRFHCKNLYEDYQEHYQNECIITLKNQYPVPKRISYGFDQFYLTSYQDTTKLSIKIYSGELKYFYPNYKDYYYLPEEDLLFIKCCLLCRQKLPDESQSSHLLQQKDRLFPAPASGCGLSLF